MIARLIGQQQAATPPAGAVPWGVQAPAVAPNALLLRVQIPVNGGTAGGYLSVPLPPGATPESIQQVAQMISTTWPVEVNQQRRGGGGYGGGYGGGGYGGGGGYSGQRPGWNGRRW